MAKSSLNTLLILAENDMANVKQFVKKDNKACLILSAQALIATLEAMVRECTPTTAEKS